MNLFSEIFRKLFPKNKTFCQQLNFTIHDLGDGNDIKYELNWRQTVNPFSKVDTHVSPTDMRFGPEGGQPAVFSGLTLSANQNLAWLDGELNGAPNYRFYGVGNKADMNGRIPAYNLNGNRYTAGRVQLYVGIYGKEICTPVAHVLRI